MATILKVEVEMVRFRPTKNHDAEFMADVIGSAGEDHFGLGDSECSALADLSRHLRTTGQAFSVTVVSRRGFLKGRTRPVVRSVASACSYSGTI